jgi:hypothetical protein
MCDYGAVRWQPTSVLLEAYLAVGDALRRDRVRVGDILECAAYVDALETELSDRAVIRDPVASAVSLVTRDGAVMNAGPDIRCGSGGTV